MNDTNNQSDKITRFVVSLYGSSLASGLKMTPVGLFIPEPALEQILHTYQLWLKSDTAAEGLLETTRCREHLFGPGVPGDYYLLDGKNCLVGNLIKLPIIPEFKIKFPFYAGTPIDGRLSIHPKDPILSRLPPEVQILTSSSGMQLRFTLRGATFNFPLNRFQEIAYLIGNSPRLRRHRQIFRQSLRKAVPELAVLLKQARISSSSNLRFIPGKLRRKSDLIFLSLADLVFTFDSQKNFMSGFGFKAKNLLDFIHDEILELRKSLKSKKIGELDLRFSNRQIAGSLRSNQEKFPLEYRAIMDFTQIWRSDRQSTKGEAPTLFDMLNELSLEFYKSNWTLERDIAPRFRGKSRDGLNYRTTKGWVFWINKKSHLVSLRRRPVVISPSEHTAPISS